MTSRIVHPKMGQSLREVFPSLCTIQTVTFTVSASSQKVPSGGTNVAGMVNIPCNKSALSKSTPAYDERRSGKAITEFENDSVKLRGYFPQIQPRTHQAVVDGVTLQIRGVEHDSLHFSTKLRVEVVTP